MIKLDIAFMVDPTIVRNNPDHHKYFFERRALAWAKTLASKGVKVGLIYPSTYGSYEEIENILFIPLNPWELYSHVEQVNTNYREVGHYIQKKLKELRASLRNSTVFMWEGYPLSLAHILDCYVVEMCPGVFSREPFPFSIRFTMKGRPKGVSSRQTITDEVIQALKEKCEPEISKRYDKLTKKAPVIKDVEIIYPLGLDNYYNYIDTYSQEERLHNAIRDAHSQKKQTLFTEHNTMYARGFLISDSVSAYINSTEFCKHLPILRKEDSPTQILAYKHEVEAPFMTTSLLFQSELWKTGFRSWAFVDAGRLGLNNTLPDCYLHENPEVFLEIANTQTVKYVDIQHWLSEAKYA